MGRLWSYRRILRLLVARDLKIRYAGSALGYLWSVLDPLLMSLVYWFVFAEIFHRKAGFDPYILFLISGQLPWYWISGGVSSGSRALRSEAQMVRSTNVPRELWVLRMVLSRGVEYVLSLPVLVIFAVAYLKAPHVQIVYMPLAMLMVVVLLSGIGLIVAPLTVLARDVERIIPIVMRIAFYFSPVLYSITNIPKHLHLLMSLNPIAGIMVLFRATFFPQELNTPHKVAIRDAAGHLVRNAAGHVQTHTVYSSNWGFVWHSAVICVLIFVIGLIVFARLERPVLKEI
jgi:ABC-2 type transport system permease protein